MSSAVVNLTFVSKRMLDKREAAEHCGRSVREFERECPVRPVGFPNGDLRWDVRDLDRWLDTLKSGLQDSAEAIIERLGS
jgi:hypothetical protein